jgi:hypothetical protein
MNKEPGKWYGIFGTIIIHLAAGIIFMSFQIKSLQMDVKDEFVIEFVTIEEIEDDTKLIELPGSSVEKILQGDDEMLNIVRNLANKSVQTINPEDYIDMVKEEMIKNGMLGTDNYIDEQKKAAEVKNDEKIAFENDKSINDNKNTPKESQEMAANFKGPTRIYYDLQDRTHTYLPIPIYKCEGSGQIMLSIEVNQKGVVAKARIVANKSTTSSRCLIETAIKSALSSRFNSDINAPKIQTGTLSYHFIAQ